MIASVWVWSNCMVMVFDQDGVQMGEYQGRLEEVRERILRDANEATEFFYGVWNEHWIRPMGILEFRRACQVDIDNHEQPS